MKSSINQISIFAPGLAWQLPGHVFVASYLFFAVALTLSAWAGFYSQTHVNLLRLRLDLLQKSTTSEVFADAKTQLSFISTLRAQSYVAEISKAIQSAADHEEARITSVQAEDHAATENSLGHRDVTVSFKAPYPGTIAALREVLNRYPEASLHQISFVSEPTTQPVTAGNAPAIGGPLPSLSTSMRSQATLFFWSRPAIEATAQVSEVDNQRPSRIQNAVTLQGSALH